MRDIAVTLLVFGSIPLILKRPWFGIIALTTIFAFATSKEPKQIPWTREAHVLAIFVAWMCITTVFAMFPDLAREQLIKVLKIQVMIFVAMMLIVDKYRLNLLVLTIALSIGFYGVKGGIFTIASGGIYHVQGPPGTFIEGNNEIGLALAMTVPLLYYSARQAVHRFARPALFVAMVLTAIAAIGTQSRGALLGMAAMGIMFWLKARQKFLLAGLAVVSVFAIVSIMPQQWYDRMSTIQNYQADSSAVGRINAWKMAWNMAKDRPLGGGFESFQWITFRMYAPDPDEVHDSHSIYFQVLGHHGFVGLALFLILAIMMWFSASRLRRETKALPEMHWLGELATMVQVSLVAYLSAGAFLGLAYFDY